MNLQLKVGLHLHSGEIGRNNEGEKKSYEKLRQRRSAFVSAKKKKRKKLSIVRVFRCDALARERLEEKQLCN